MPAKVVVRWLRDGALRVGGLEDVAAARGTGSVWIDVHGPDEKTLQVLGEAFSLHPLAVEDCLHFPQRPKLDAYDHGPFIVWVVPNGAGDGAPGRAEVDIFLGSDYLITSHRVDVVELDCLAKDAERILSRGPAWLLHSFLDRSVDAAFPLLDNVSDELDQLEDRLVESPTPDQLQRLYGVKRKLVSAHKIIGPERDVLRALVREQAYVNQEAYLYLQDVGDHLARLEDSVDTYRDLAGSVMDVYLSAVSNRLNVIMKRLTIVATVFMPGTLIAGIYGMNFQHMPELAWRFGYAWMLGLTVAVTGGMLLWFKRSDWW